jgi:5'-nucleotidase (lipoprotein e(P4) family)
MKSNLFFCLALVGLTFACSSGKKTVSTPASATPNAGAPNMADAHASLMTDGPLWGSVYQQRAAEYEALCFQAYNAARWRLDAVLAGSGSATGGANTGTTGGANTGTTGGANTGTTGGANTGTTGGANTGTIRGASATPAQGLPLAIVTDIDETLLDNSPYAVHQALAGHTYNDSSWIAWTAKVACDTVPGALAFLKYAASKGVDIYYITNRLEVERTPTLQNLQKWGFPEADNDHLVLRAAGSASSKETRRLAVAQSHKIIMLLGDNLSDFAALFDHQPVGDRKERVEASASLFGSTFIVLPNAVYGDWEGAMYNYHYPKTQGEKAKILIDSLKTY